MKTFAFSNLELMQTDIENRMKIHNRAQNRKLAKSPVSNFKINSIFLRNHEVWIVWLEYFISSKMNSSEKFYKNLLRTFLTASVSVRCQVWAIISALWAKSKVLENVQIEPSPDFGPKGTVSFDLEQIQRYHILLE